ncbi:MAG: urate hydroxylase PuuD [Thermoplasmatota archaeon]
MASPLVDFEPVLRYLHILAGITWIGLLYFFNLVNLPLLKFDLKKPFTVDMTEKATANITLKTLFWFRWGAMLTFILGLLLFEAVREGYASWSEPQGLMIIMGMAFGTIMWGNVWFVIWPAQQKILTNNKKIAESGDEGGKLAAENAPNLKKAVLASRTNTWLSIPMLFGMVMGAHGGRYGTEWADWLQPLAVLAALLVGMIAYSKKN